MSVWYLYIAMCIDGALYTGITTDLARREREHNRDDKKGAKSLRGKRPIRIVYFEKYHNISEARKREHTIKHLARESKLKLIQKGEIQGLP